MIFLCFLILGALLVILQTTLLMPSPLWAFAPDFYFIFVAYLASHFTVLGILRIKFIENSCNFNTYTLIILIIN